MILRGKIILCRAPKWEETEEIVFKAERTVCANTKAER